jgi:hypothetical protein
VWVECLGQSWEASEMERLHWGSKLCDVEKRMIKIKRVNDYMVLM